jgi:hypothetical protein
LLIQHIYQPPLMSAWWLTLAWMPVASFLFARHAKSLFLAMDHYFDPHVVVRSTASEPDSVSPRRDEVA